MCGVCFGRAEWESHMWAGWPAVTASVAGGQHARPDICESPDLKLSSVMYYLLWPTRTHIFRFDQRIQTFCPFGRRQDIHDPNAWDNQVSLLLWHFKLFRFHFTWKRITKVIILSCHWYYQDLNNKLDLTCFPWIKNKSWLRLRRADAQIVFFVICNLIFKSNQNPWMTLTYSSLHITEGKFSRNE